MRSGEPRNPPPDQSADHGDGHWRFGVPGTKAGREVTARAWPAPGYVRRRQECMQSPAGQCHRLRYAGTRSWRARSGEEGQAACSMR